MTAFVTPWGLYEWVRIVSADGYRVDTSKVKAVLALKETNPKTVGLAGVLPKIHTGLLQNCTASLRTLESTWG